MKKIEAIFNFVAQAWTAGLFLTFAVAIAYVIWALCTGNYGGTGSRCF